MSHDSTAPFKGLFCNYPFEFMELGLKRQGRIEANMCCRSWLPHDIGDLGQQSLDQVWNSEKAQKIRASILDGSFSFCRHDLCPKIQNGGLWESAKVTDPYLRDVIENKKTRMAKGPRQLSLANDQSCNLACPSCRTDKIMHTSGSAFEEMLQMHEEVFAEALKDLEMVSLCSSGDPFASRAYRKFLTETEGSKYPDLKIQIVTNGQLLTPQMWQKMHKIHRNLQLLFVSVDAARPETYRQVRRGGELEPLLKNLAFLGERRAENAFEHFQLDFVVQAKNFREIPQFIELGLSLGADKLFFQRISNWGTFSPAAFSQQDICDRSHPDHGEFLRVLKHPLLSHPKVIQGNMAGFVAAAPTHRSVHDKTHRTPPAQESRV